MKKIIDIKTINNVVNKYKRVLINKGNKPLERKKYILKIKNCLKVRPKWLYTL